MNAPLKIDSRAQVITDANGDAYLCSEHRVRRLRGVPPDVLRRALELADGTHDAETVLRLLTREGGASAELARDLVEALAPIVHEPAVAFAAPAIERELPALAGARILVVGNGPFALALLAELRGALPCACDGLSTRVFSSCISAEFRAEQSRHVLHGPHGSREAGAQDAGAHELEWVECLSVGQLVARLDGVDALICAVEGTPLRALLDVNQAALHTGTPCLFVTPCGDGALIGPTSIPTLGPCLSCRELALRFGGESASGERIIGLLEAPPFSGSADLVHGIAALVAHEVSEVILPSGAANLQSAVTFVTDADWRHFALERHPGCPSCQRSPLAQRVATRMAIAATVSQRWLREPTEPRATCPYRSIGIIGGGTAGYLTALGLKAKFPELEVELVESSQIGVIGVGEATTPEIVKFLHSPRFLGLDVAELFRAVQPTFKLGIRFYWGPPGPQCFNFPFQRGRLLESMLYEGHLNDQSLGSLLMTQGRVPAWVDERERVSGLFHSVRTAYHLENRAFVAYLQDQAKRAGIRCIDAVIQHVSRDASGGIASLRTSDGRDLRYDLYVDSTGFRSLLMGQALGARFSSYASSLFTDTAVVGRIPHSGRINPYTFAETMENGWCWSIPFADEDHRGYVFASAFCSAEQALEEMRAKNPGLLDPWTVRFQSGRREHFWKHNVVAMGNAYGFVEPLESTAIHMAVLMVDMLTTHLGSAAASEAARARLNDKVAAHWDDLRAFLSIHYRFNRKSDSRFWQVANHEVDIEAAQPRLQRFRERAPTSYRSSLFYRGAPASFFSDDHSFDTLLMGQRVPTAYEEPQLPAATWRGESRALRQAADRALTQRAFLERVQQEPELMRPLVEHPQTWIHGWPHP